MVILTIVVSLLAVAALVGVRKAVVYGRTSESMCRELVAHLASSENERILITDAYLDATTELEDLRTQKLGAWGIPDSMGEEPPEE